MGKVVCVRGNTAGGSGTSRNHEFLQNLLIINIAGKRTMLQKYDIL